MINVLELKEAACSFYTCIFEGEYGISYKGFTFSIGRPCQKYDNQSDLPNFLEILNLEIKEIRRKKREMFREKSRLFKENWNASIIQRAWRNSNFAWRPDTIVGLNRLRDVMIEDGLDAVAVNAEIDSRISEIIS
jgi:hypothetical protein